MIMIWMGNQGYFLFFIGSKAIENLEEDGLMASTVSRVANLRNRRVMLGMDRSLSV